VKKVNSISSDLEFSVPFSYLINGDKSNTTPKTIRIIPKTAHKSAIVSFCGDKEGLKVKKVPIPKKIIPNIIGVSFTLLIL